MKRCCRFTDRPALSLGSPRQSLWSSSRPLPTSTQPHSLPVHHYGRGVALYITRETRSHWPMGTGYKIKIHRSKLYLLQSVAVDDLTSRAASHRPPMPPLFPAVVICSPFRSPFLLLTRVSATSQSWQFRYSHVPLLSHRFCEAGVIGSSGVLSHRTSYLPCPPSLLIYPTPSQAISCWPSANHAAILSCGLLSLTPLPADSADPCRCPALRSVQVRGTACHWLVRLAVDDALLELCEAC